MTKSNARWEKVNEWSNLVLANWQWLCIEPRKLLKPAKSLIYESNRRYLREVGLSTPSHWTSLTK